MRQMSLFTYYLCTVHGTHNDFIKKKIKNESHSTIHTFKKYFATVFSVSTTISSIQMEPNGALPEVFFI